MSALSGLRTFGVSAVLAVVAFVASSMLVGVVLGMAAGFGVVVPAAPVIGNVSAVPGGGWGAIVSTLVGGYTFLWGLA